MNEGNAKQQIVEAIKANSNILVTVSDSPSVDELSAALGLTVLLNKISKRATSIFSGTIPPAIQFLDPEKTFEGTVDSLRDFIIALDKEKADHLRYKVDGDVVKIFITPYRTTLSDKDLEFTQGDYNVEMVIALGVKEQAHLDKALEAHGKIFHDATVATISAGSEPSTMGSIGWYDPEASSLCEMLVSLTEALKGDDPVIDEVIATAYLTGIVSATDRFSNNRTSSRVMTMAAQLMAAGANQQLIAAQLQEAHDISPEETPSTSGNRDKKAKKDAPKKEKESDTDSIKIDRNAKKVTPPEPATEPAPAPETPPIETPAPAPTEPVDEAAVDAAVQAATEVAAPAGDIEQELSAQLADMTAPPALPADELQKELTEAAAENTPVADMSMPGFEALDVPPAPTDTPASQGVSGAIDARAGSSYVETPAAASFDTPVENIITGADGNPDQYVDPFQTPLAPLPDLHDGGELAPPAQPDPVPVTAPPLPPLPPLPPTDMPPLPGLSDTALPPLPPPPPPPVFGQPAASPDMPSDTLGDIFGSAPAPQAPQPPSEPPKPGQFQIPGQ